MITITVKTMMEQYGYSREQAEREVKRANCEHDFGDMCRSSFMGCVRTCVKCDQKQALGRNCWQHRSTSAKR